MNKSTFTFLSHDKSTQIRAIVWQKSKEPRAIVQIIHGAAEHIERYTDFAEFLCDAGIVVCGADHIGHGKSVSSKKQLGHMPLKDGREILIEDTHSLYQKIHEQYPTLPYILFGHSMGSFILREYLTQHSQEVFAAIISGTGQQSKALSVVGGAVAKIIAKLKGAETRNGLLHNLGLGAYSKQIPNARTKLDWLSNDPKVVDEYIADEECGMKFSAGSYATLTDLTGKMVEADSASKIAKEIPLLFIAGEDDPVGEKGRGVLKAVEQYKQAEIKNITCNIYPNMRHEVLNELEKQKVYQDILQWIEQCLTTGK